MNEVLLLGFLVLVVPVSGLLAAVTPYLMPKRECFAVTIPEAAWQDGQLRAYRRRYALWCAVLTAIATAAVACVASGAAGQGGASPAYGSLACAMVLATFAVTLVPFAFMLHFRKKVAALKRERGWAATRQQAAALVAEEDVPRAISPAWNLLYIPVVLVILGVGAALYPSMPDMIPMHADFQGNVTDYAPKSLGVVFGFPLLITAFMLACFLFSHWSMLRSKCPTNPGSPVTSALAYGMFARAQSVFLLITGLSLTLGISLGFMLAAAGIVTLGQMAAVIVVGSLFIVAGAIILSVVYGQSGSRLFLRMAQAGGEDALLMPADDDEHWKLGVFYFNRDDASLWIPERFGIGWTLNLARPAAWAVLIGFAVLTAVFVAMCAAIAG